MRAAQQPATRSCAKRVLVVEDEYFLAMDLSAELTRRGYTVVGPAPTIEKARALAREGPLSGAVLDMCLAGRPVFDVVRDLLSDDVPFLFVSGYSTPEIPSWVPPRLRYTKPLDAAEVADAVDRMTAESAVEA
jgi:ActR/RegA family two-component response regulator